MMFPGIQQISQDETLNLLYGVFQKVENMAIGTFDGIFNKDVILINGDGGDEPPLIEFRRMLAGVERGRGQIGYLGSTEMNMTVNMNYRDGTHKYFDTTKPAIWSYLGNSTGQLHFGLQFTQAGHPNDDTMWTVWGREIFKVDSINHLVTNEAVHGGSLVTLQQIDFVNGNYNGTTAKLQYSGPGFYIQGATLLYSPSQRIKNGGNEFVDNDAIATYKTTGKNNYFIFAQEDNSVDFNKLRFLKNKAGSYNIGAGTKVFEFDVNGGVGFFGTRATANVNGGWSNVEFYFKTTNSAGANADRLVITDNGILRVLNMPNFANDAAAAAGNVPIDGVYRDGNNLKIRIA